MQPGLQAAGAGWGVLALVFLLGSYLAVVSRLAAVWDRTRYTFRQYEEHRSLPKVACVSACASPPWALHPHTQRLCLCLCTWQCTRIGTRLTLHVQQ